MEAPEGYPYFKATFITEQSVWSKDEEREVPYYETHPGTMDFSKFDPLYWYRYKLENPDHKTSGTCIVLCCLDTNGNEHELMFDDTLPKFDEKIKQWIEYANTICDTPPTTN